MSEKRPIIISELRDDEIMKRAIDKARKNGWRVGGTSRYFVRKLYTEKQMFSQTFYNGINTIIFSHFFAKAFWGEQYISSPVYHHGEVIDDLGLPAWQYHLQVMVLEENPLNYIKKFVEEEQI